MSTTANSGSKEGRRQRVSDSGLDDYFGSTLDIDGLSDYEFEESFAKALDALQRSRYFDEIQHCPDEMDRPLLCAEDYAEANFRGYLSQNREVVDLSAEDVHVLPSDSGGRPVRANRRVREPKQRNWLFTWNNYSDFEAPQRWPGVDFLVYQEEIAPSTGTRHLQGYVQFAVPKRPTQLVKLARINWIKQNARGGSVEDIIEYCEKEESRAPGGRQFKRGVPKVERQRSDLTELANELLSGKPLQDIVAAHPTEAIRYSKGFQFVSQFAAPPPMLREVEVRLYIGPTGTGKTYSAVTEFPNSYVKGPDKWFDHYHGQKEVVFDDFSGAGSHIGLAQVLRLFDKYRLNVEIKGSYQWFRAETIVITTNLHPLAWYNYEGRMEQYRALLRRFAVIRVFTARGVYTDLHPSDTTQEFVNFESGVGWETGRGNRKGDE